MDKTEEVKKILIVDDDIFLLDMYALKFSKSNFSVSTALGPEIAIEKLRSSYNPDVILTDIVMPVMDGFEMLEKIKEENLSKGSVVIFLSNRGQQSDVEKAISLGAAGYIVKASSTPSEVIVKVEEIINSKDCKKI